MLDVNYHRLGGVRGEAEIHENRTTFPSALNLHALSAAIPSGQDRGPVPSAAQASSQPPNQGAPQPRRLGPQTLLPPDVLQNISEF